MKQQISPAAAVIVIVVVVVLVLAIGFALTKGKAKSDKASEDKDFAEQERQMMEGEKGTGQPTGDPEGGAMPSEGAPGTI